MRSTRRELVAAAAAGATLAAVPPAWGARLLGSTPRIGPGDFLDGVASGEPSSQAVTFWSRLETDRPRSGARLVVAEDKGLERVVATALVPTGLAINGTLKARIGGLRPSTEYWYAWESGTGQSPVGRTRTAPAASSGDPLRLAFSSCQNYTLGYFTAHQHAAQQELDVYLFLGDYIYETGIPDVGAAYPRTDTIDSNDLDSYRRKYRLYRGDAGLRELHRLHPTIHVWDDHEVHNNYNERVDPPLTRAQRDAAYRAAFEWLPRLVQRDDRYRIYRRIPYGRMADLFLLDERQYRRGDRPGEPRRILGDQQMEWLIRELKASTATWKVIAQQVVVAMINFGTGTNSDAWDGYTEDRARLLGEIEKAQIDNVVFLSGDVHTFMVNLLGSDFAALGDGAGPVKPAGVEYVGGSITSPGIPQPEPVVQAQNPWNRQYDAVQHGYAAMALSPEQLVTDYRTSVFLSPSGPTATFERFTQPVGENQVGRQQLPAPAAAGRRRSRA